MKAEYIYDSSKRVWVRTASACHGAYVRQQMLFMDKPIKPGFKLVDSVRAPIRVTVERKWYQLWKPRTWRVTTGYKDIASTKDVTFCWYCTECGKRAKIVHDFVLEDSSPKLDPNKGMSEGQLSVSKTERVGSTPAIPAKGTHNTG